MADLEYAEAGEKTNKLWLKLNAAVDALVPLQDLTVSPEGLGEFKQSESNTVLTLKTVDLVACDASGNEFTFRLVGFQVK